MYKFVVRQEQPGEVFPVDMLRYDQCWPASWEDSLLLIKPMPLQNEVAFLSNKRPTKRRWASFGWLVVKVEKLPK